MNPTQPNTPPAEAKEAQNYRPDTREEDLEIVRHWLREAHSATHIDVEAIPERMARDIVRAVHKGSDEALDAFARIIRKESDRDKLAGENAELREQFQKAAEWNKLTELELTNLRCLNAGLDEDITTLRAELDAVRKDRQYVADSIPGYELTIQKARDERDSALARAEVADRGLSEAIECLERYGPALPKGHFCGPESQCDGLCMEVAHFDALLERLRALLTPSPAREHIQMQAGEISEKGGDASLAPQQIQAEKLTNESGDSPASLSETGASTSSETASASNARPDGPTPSGAGLWQPIETAPRNGLRILGWCYNWSDSFIVKWSPRRPAPHWTVDSGAVTDSAPTHWQPLPAPPTP